MAKKKDPKVLRMCIDFRNLNAVTVKDAYPLPRVDDTITSLGAARFFTTLDLGSAFWQIVMKHSDRPQTAFACKGDSINGLGCRSVCAMQLRPFNA